MGKRWLIAMVGLAACGDDGTATMQDAKLVDAPSPDATCTVTASTDHTELWPTLCDTADACGWLTGGHPELENDEASCNTRHASDPDVSSVLPYMSAFEMRVHAAASCLGCQALVDAYFRPDLETVFCGHVSRCGFLTDSACRTQYQMDAARPGSQAKFDYACPRYCIEQLASDAACTDVMACLQACT